MQEYTTLEKPIKELKTLLKSQIVYDYMLSLMGAKPSSMACIDKNQATRVNYDKTRPEVQNATEAQITKLRETEKEKLVQLLRSSYLMQQIALLDVGIACARHIPGDKLRENLANPTLIKKRQYGGMNIRACADLIRQ